MSRSLQATVPPALLFDLDGTLIDSLPDVRRAINHVLEAKGWGALSRDDVLEAIGHGARQLVCRCFAKAGAPLVSNRDRDQAVAAYLATYAEHLVIESQPYPGVVATLERLSADGYPLGVCTNKPSDLARRLLEHFAMSRFFSAVVGGDEGGARKPDAEHPRATLRAMGQSGGSALFVGDSENDVAAARAAGMPVIVVGFGYASGGADRLGADRVIDRFEDLPLAIAELLAPSP